MAQPFTAVGETQPFTAVGRGGGGGEGISGGGVEGGEAQVTAQVTASEEEKVKECVWQWVSWAEQVINF